MVRTYLEGQGDLVSGLLMGIAGVTIWVRGVVNLLTPDPPSRALNPKPNSAGGFTCTDKRLA